MNSRILKTFSGLISLCLLLFISGNLTAAPLPRVYLQTSATVVPPGGSIRLTWTTSNVSRCEARGDWYGARDVNGGWNLNWLERNHEYQLICYGPGGSAMDSVSITVGDADKGATSPVSDDDTVEEPAPESDPDPVEPPPTAPSGDQPWVSLQSSDPSIPIGGSVRLTWESQNVSSCQAGGAWGGQKEVDGGWNLNNLYRTHTYELTCQGSGGQTSDSVTVYVGESAPGELPGSESGSGSDSGSGTDSGSDGGDLPSIQPTVALSVSDPLIDAGGTTRLSWSSSDASYCRAAGGPWSGNRGTSGSESSGAIYSTTTYTIQCSNGDLSAISMVTVAVREQMTVTWQAPTENTDGSPLTNLAGYRIYFGDSSRNYSDYVEVSDPQATQHTFSIPSGSYVVAMTSLDSEGNESVYSNEVRLSTW